MLSARNDSRLHRLDIISLAGARVKQKEAALLQQLESCGECGSQVMELVDMQSLHMKKISLIPGDQDQLPMSRVARLHHVLSAKNGRHVENGIGIEPVNNRS